MKIALVGATGFIGSVLREEALRRGHKVTAIVRDTSKLPAAPELVGRSVDVGDVAALTDVVRGHDVLVSAFNPTLETGPQGSKNIVEATKAAGVARVLHVGGGGSLILEDGRRFNDTELFPDAWREGSRLGGTVLDWLRGVSDVDWVYFSPPEMIMPGQRTGKFRLGHDHLLRDAAGKSEISVEDYAVAMLDEVETPSHHRERFTIAY